MADMRTLIALVGALSQNGDTLNAQTVAYRLGLSIDDAQELLDQIIAAGGDMPDAGRLPLSYDEDGNVVYNSPLTHRIEGRGLRLTHQEAQALTAAFERIGLDTQSELRRAVECALYPTDSSELPVFTDAQAVISHVEHEKLDALSQAILDSIALEFDYVPTYSTLDLPIQRRHVVPLTLSHENEHWYLDAYDLDRADNRRFRIDRMRGLVTTEASTPNNIPEDMTAVASSQPRKVNLMFSDRTLLEMHDWPTLTITGHGHGSVACEIEWYPQSMWLVRHLAACGSVVRIYDEELKQVVAAYAESIRRGSSDSCQHA